MTFTAQGRITKTGRECLGCTKFKRWDKFAPYKRGVNGRRAVCRTCENKKREKYAPARAEYMFGYRLLRSFNITLDQYKRLLAAQGGVCVLCRQPETMLSPMTGEVQRLAVEHDRRCCPGNKSCGKCIRGLACKRCNWLIGLFESEYGQLVIPQLPTYLDARPLAA